MFSRLCAARKREEPEQALQRSQKYAWASLDFSGGWRFAVAGAGMGELPAWVLQAWSSPKTGSRHLPVTLKGFAGLGSSVGLQGSCQFSFTCTVLLGKPFVPCPFPVKHLWGLVVFPLGQFPSLVCQVVMWTAAVDASLCRCRGSWRCPQEK